MIIISYDIADDKIRTQFSKMLQRYGAIRLQFSVYEMQNTNRIVDVLKVHIEDFSKHFTPADSVVVFDVDSSHLIKYGNAIHRDKDIVFL